ncbi:MAG: hypothetical protein H0W72_14825 [Planctomycetes bacterium]|nr:hypothetical protein [Planctomycetota bacterium]
MDAYTPSGRLGRMPLLLVLVGVPAMAVLSAAYSYLIVWLPIAGWITFLITFGFAFCAGVVASLIGSRGHCRSPGAMRLAGLALGCVALYGAWIFFLHALIGRDPDPGEKPTLLTLVTNPAGCWSVIQALNAEGWYTIKSMTPSGIVLWAFWAIEAAIIVGGITLIAPGGVTNELYCETCGKWCVAVETTWRQLTREQGNEAVDQLDPATLYALPAVAQAKTPSLKIERLTCPDCETAAGLRFTRCIESTNDKGETKTAEQIVCPIQLIAPGELKPQRKLA